MRTLFATALLLAAAAASAQSVQVGTAEGWEIVAAPGAAETIGSFFGPVWTQCFPGADATGGACATSGPNVFLYDERATGDENVGYAAPAAATDPFDPGVGAFAYLFADDNADGTDEAFPKTLPLAGAEPALPFTWGDPEAGADAPLRYTDTGAPDADGWNLLGNPRREAFSWNATWDNGAPDVSPTAYAFDRAAAAYTTFDAQSNVRGGAGSAFSSDGLLDVGRGFYVKATGASPSLTAPDLGDPPPPPGRARDDDAAPHLAVTVSEIGGPRRGGAVLILVDGATPARDPADAPALLPPSAPYVVAGFVTEPEGTPFASAVVAPPDAGSAGFEAELAIGAAGLAAAELSWTSALGAGWRAVLLDRATGAEVLMGPGGTVALDLSGLGAEPAPGRFAVRVQATGGVASEPAASGPAVSALAPNPTTGRATLWVTLSAPGPLRATVRDVLGREVAVLHDGPAPAATLGLALDAGALAPGLYVVRVVGPGVTASRTVTVTR